MPGADAALGGGALLGAGARSGARGLRPAQEDTPAEVALCLARRELLPLPGRRGQRQHWRGRHNRGGGPRADAHAHGVQGAAGARRLDGPRAEQGGAARGAGAAVLVLPRPRQRDHWLPRRAQDARQASLRIHPAQLLAGARGAEQGAPRRGGAAGRGLRVRDAGRPGRDCAGTRRTAPRRFAPHAGPRCPPPLPSCPARAHAPPPPLLSPRHPPSLPPHPHHPPPCLPVCHSLLRRCCSHSRALLSSSPLGS